MDGLSMGLPDWGRGLEMGNLMETLRPSSDG